MRRKVFLGGGLLAAALVAWPFATHYRLAGRLERYHEELRRRGEKLSVEEFRPRPPSDALLAIQSLVSAANQLTDGPTNAPPTMLYLTNGFALAAWRQPVYPTEEASNLWPGLDMEFEGRQPALAALREVLRAPQLTAAVDYSQGFNITYIHSASVKRAAAWLSAAAVRDLHSGRPGAAFDNTRALVALGNSYRGEPTLISVLTRLNACAFAARTCWEALDSTAFAETQWSELQSLWEQVEFLPHAEAALAMERALGMEFYRAARSAYGQVSQAGFGTGQTTLDDLAEIGQKLIVEPGDAMRSFNHRFPGYWRWKWVGSYVDELAMERTLQIGIDALRSARGEPWATAFGNIETETARLRRDLPHAGSWIGVWWVYDSGMLSFIRRIADLETQRRLLITAIALERHSLRHGARASELGQLCPDFLPKPPEDLDGRPLRFQRAPRAAPRLYSVGPNGIDDGGSTAGSDARWENRRWFRLADAVWPQAADPEQVEAHFARIDAARHKRQTEEALTAAQMTPREAELFRKRYGLDPAPAAK